MKGPTIETHDWRVAFLTTSVLVLLGVVALAGIALLTEALSTSGADVATYNRLVGRAFLVAGVGVLLGSIAVPWLTVRRSRRRWPANALTLAPFLGLASCVGCVAGFGVAGVGVAFLLEGSFGPIPQNSLLDIPIAAASLLGSLVGAMLGPVVLLAVYRRLTVA
jgi:uncharacterized membrane protein YidH (DUF202 family)